MSIAIVTDTACNITPAQAEELGVYLLPLEITIDDQNYKDGFDIDTEEFYQKMSVAEKVPSTAQPKTGDAYRLYEKLSESYDQILGVHLGSSVSGTVQALRLIGKEIEEIDVTIYDTQLLSIPAGYLVIEAKRLVDQGKDIPEIIEHLDQLRDKSVAFAAIHTLDNLVESGRVPAVVGTVAKLAKIKPIITIKASEEKGLDLTEKVRTSKRANKKLIQLAQEYIESVDYPVQLDVAHGNIPDMAAEVKSELEALYPEQDIHTHLLTSVIGAHSGPEIVGIFVAPR